MRFLPIVIVLAIFATVSVFHIYVYNNANQLLANRENTILNEARLHYENLVNTRKWNAQYGGVYVHPVKGLDPNPYLKENTLVYDGNKTLIKINPAWMTRQLSEIETIEDLHFSITSLKPINPGNAPDAFEREGLEYIEKHDVAEYYRFDDESDNFHYIGALRVTPACMPCHQSQGYRVGDLRGGIHVMLSNTGYGSFTEEIAQRAQTVQTMAYTLGFALLLVALYAFRKHKQTEALNRSLETKVAERTLTLQKKQLILQEMLDRQPDGILLMQGTEIIDANQTMWRYCGIRNKSELAEEGCSFESRIIPVEQEGYLQAEMEGIHWSDYILHHHGIDKVKLQLPTGTVAFEVHAKQLEVSSNEQLKLISLSDITQHEKLVENLTRSALTDALTGIYNRKKFDDELASCLSVRLDLNMDISLIMIDIDLFKQVNDQYGHNTGDRLLKSFSGRIASLLREQDFLARWGGEEFVAILYHTPVESAVGVAEKLRRNIETHPFFDGLKITASFGVTQLHTDDTAHTLLERVDRALYRAKETGRNKVVKL